MDDTPDTTTEELGPVDYVVIEFPAGQQNFTGEVAEELARLSESGVIRVLDLLLISKNEDGSVDALEIDDTPEVRVGQPRPMMAMAREAARPEGTSGRVGDSSSAPLVTASGATVPETNAPGVDADPVRAALIADIKKQLGEEMGWLPVSLLRERRASQPPACGCPAAA